MIVIFWAQNKIPTANPGYISFVVIFLSIIVYNSFLEYFAL